MPTLTLDSVAAGETATIYQVNGEPGLHQRLYALGFRGGRQIQMVRRGWLSGPLHIRIGTTEVMLRRREAQSVLVTRALSGV
jgi:ferrous iron transport protein A